MSLFSYYLVWYGAYWANPHSRYVHSGRYEKLRIAREFAFYENIFTVNSDSERNIKRTIMHMKYYTVPIDLHGYSCVIRFYLWLVHTGVEVDDAAATV